jgi:calcineurin-like phosphoesterase family protein
LENNLSKIWFTSDIHFGHKKIIEFCATTRGHFNNVEEMNQGIIKRWQEQVAPDDTVYILGDVFFTSATEAKSILSQLPGKKHLILGNHDKMIRSDVGIQEYFESIHEYLTVVIDGIKVVMFHFPIYEWDNMHYGAYHVYGHVHGRAEVDGRCMDVGIDSRSDNSLWSWEEVNDILSKEPIRSHH